jgi:hypothetical protein
MHKSQTSTVEDTLQGVYLPFKRIWEMEGSDRAGYTALSSHKSSQLSGLSSQLSGLSSQLSALSSQAALKHTAKCRLLRGRFLHYNVMTERVEYLHVTSSTREVFTRQWNLISKRAVRKDLLDEAR